jgi:hypothetical protein
MHHINNGFGVVLILILFVIVIGLASSGGSKS